MNKCISPSLMCCDFFRFNEQIKIFENECIEFLHIDVMDGRFVPNYTLGTNFIKQVKRQTSIPIDLHLMIEAPENKLERFTFGTGDIVSVHAESTRHLELAIQKIKRRGAMAFVAINPATPVYVLEEVAEELDGVLVMTVNPGFAGQKLVGSCLNKITKVRAFLDGAGRKDARIEVDGNVSYENAVLMSNAGADIFVAGTSSIFSADIPDGIKKLRDCIA